ncbi:MAG: hypothetical protein ABJB01_14135, partial [Rudaea sp.]
MRTNVGTSIAFGIIIGTLSAPAWARSGDPDPYFATHGIASLHFSSPILPVVEPIVVDQRNRIVFGVSTTDGDFVYALNANGAIDTSFFCVTLDQYVVDVKIDSHNRIVVTELDDSGASLGIRVARYTDSGDIDATFAGIGYVILSLPHEDIVADAMALDSDDAIVIVGTEPSEPTSGDSRILLAKIDSDGKPDPAFGGRGLVSLSLLAAGTEQSYGTSVAIGLHHDIVVTGYSRLPTRVVVDDIAKLTRDGVLDPSFGHGAGFVQTDALSAMPAPRYSFSESVAIDSRGNIVTSGFAGLWSDFSSEFFVARYASDGTPDITFNAGAPKLFNAATFTTGQAATVLIDGRDRIVVSGVTASDAKAPNQLAIFRMNDDGSADTTFGDHGGYQLLSDHATGGRTAFAHGGDIVIIGNTDDGAALIVEKRIGYDVPPIMPPDH